MRRRFFFNVLRISLGCVFLIFGIGKFQNDYWARTMATMDFIQKLPWSAMLSVYMVGGLEVLTGTMLIFGLWTRYVAACAAAQLLAILILLAFQEVRDIGLLGAALYLTFSGEEKNG